MHVGEFGLPIVLNAALDMSTYPVLSIKFVRPNRSDLEVASPDVELGLVDIVTPIGTFLANKYAIYTFKENDLNMAGTWTCQLSCEVPGVKRLSSSPITFQVDQ